MTNTMIRRDAVANRWRIGLWGATGALLLLPLVAMQFTAEVQWDIVDFATMGAMFAVAGIGVELVVRIARRPVYRAVLIAGIAAAFILIWLELAVGIF